MVSKNPSLFGYWLQAGQDWLRVGLDATSKLSVCPRSLPGEFLVQPLTYRNFLLTSETRHAKCCVPL